MSDQLTARGTLPLIHSDDTTPIHGNLEIAEILSTGDYDFDPYRAGTVGELVDDVTQKLSERLGGDYRFPPVVTGRNGQLYAVEVCVHARPATRYEINNALAGLPLADAMPVAEVELPRLCLDDL